jgi:hypothetical protein
MINNALSFIIHHSVFCNVIEEYKRKEIRDGTESH